VSVEAFEISVPQAALDDLRERLGRTRWPDAIEGSGWDYGTNREYLQELTAYWRDRFDWRAQERAINRFPHFRTKVGGLGIHFIHQRGQGARPLPLLLIHGFPDSFLRMLKLIPRLTDPAAHGGDPADAFDVVVPSIPGFGFSDRPPSAGMNPERIAGLFGELMTRALGYTRFAAHGGDWGSSISERLALSLPHALAGIHLTEIPYAHLFGVPSGELSEPEKKYLEAGKRWQMEHGAYALVQATRPQTLGQALNDSPAGLAAWTVEMFRDWSDCGGDVEQRFTKDELLTNLTLYWVTQTITSAMRIYYESQHHPPKESGVRVEVPTGVAIFPKDLVPAPRQYGERFFNIQRWTTMPRGGHFAALEEPDLLAEDIRAFFRPLRGT
jgi:pimeloyl-ACP methyl ester carboxylesterase